MCVMDDALISKKELLALTGISYGALYRWKRKQLIPEDWFIKKSTFTGPETFFPREQVLERIAKIQEMKEQLSLDDLAVTFSGAPVELEATGMQLIERGILSASVVGLSLYSPEQTLDFYGALYLFICGGLLEDGHLSLAEADTVLSHLLADYGGFKSAPSLTVCRKMGVTFSVLSESKEKVSFDVNARLIASVNTAQAVEALKMKWGHGNEHS